jgi:hypothetical protein
MVLSSTKHEVTAIEERGWPLIVVRCACGYWQQTRRQAYFESVWLQDEIHLRWASQHEDRSPSLNWSSRNA